MGKYERDILGRVGNVPKTVSLQEIRDSEDARSSQTNREAWERAEKKMMERGMRVVRILREYDIPVLPMFEHRGYGKKTSYQGFSISSGRTYPATSHSSSGYIQFNRGWHVFTGLKDEGEGYAPSTLSFGISTRGIPCQFVETEGIVKGHQRHGIFAPRFPNYPGQGLQILQDENFKNGIASLIQHGVPLHIHPD